MTATRRLAAILAAHIAGYSRLMGADEEGTLERLKARRRELLDPKIAEHRATSPGPDRETKTTLDCLLVKWGNVADAVRSPVTVGHATRSQFSRRSMSTLANSASLSVTTV